MRSVTKRMTSTIALYVESSGVLDGLPKLIGFGPDGGWFTLLSSSRGQLSAGISEINTASLGANGSWAITYVQAQWNLHMTFLSELATKLRSPDQVKPEVRFLYAM